MFNKNGGAFEVVIGESTTFKGDVIAQGNIKVDGNVTGEIRSNGEIYIGENSTVEGDITSTNLTISGKVTGDVTAIGDLKITSSGYLEGDILVSSFIINSGGTFKGNCSINTKEAQDNLNALKNEFLPDEESKDGENPSNVHELPKKKKAVNDDSSKPSNRIHKIISSRK